MHKKAVDPIAYVKEQRTKKMFANARTARIIDVRFSPVIRQRFSDSQLQKFRYKPENNI